MPLQSVFQAGPRSHFVGGSAAAGCFGFLRFIAVLEEAGAFAFGDAVGEGAEDPEELFEVAAIGQGGGEVRA